jgi:hypothetical protein
MLLQKSALRLLGAAACALALAGCSQLRLPSREGVSPAQQAACRSRVESSYVAQNRADIYRNDRFTGSSNSPFSNTSTAAAGNEGLSSQFAYQRNLDDCYAIGATPAPETPTKP